MHLILAASDNTDALVLLVIIPLVLVFGTTGVIVLGPHLGLPVLPFLREQRQGKGT